MKRSAYWMMAALALCWTMTGCGGSKPAAQENTEAAAPATDVAATPAEAAVAPAPAA